MLPNGAIWSDDQLMKALVMADMGAGGLLPRQVQDELVKYAISYTSLLGSGGVRRRTVRQRAGQLDMMWRHQSITRKASDVFTVGTPVQGEGGGGPDVGGNLSTILTNLYDEKHRKFGSLEWNTEKMVATDSWSTETIRENIENGSLDQALRDGTLQQVGTDMAKVALNGDTSLTGTDRENRLLKANDGWDKLTQGSNIVDAGGSFISRSMFSDMAKRMPRWLMENNPNLKWIFNTDIRQDWVDVLGGRPDAIGGAAIGGQFVPPLGFPVIVEPLIRSDKVLSIAEASNALLEGIEAGPFTFKDGTNTEVKFTIDNVDGANFVNVDFGAAAGGVPAHTGEFTLTSTEVARIINARVIGGVGQPASGECAFVNPINDRLVLKSPTTGAASSVEVNNGAAENAIATLGFTHNDRIVGLAASTTPEVAGTSTQLREATDIYLTDPRNFAWVVITSDPGSNSDGVRVYAEFNKDRDRIEFIVYYNSDALVENIQAVVKATNVRTKQLTAI